MRVFVFGAGLSGLSAASRLCEGKVPVTVFESADRVGGMASSFTEDGFTYDLGPHRFHSSDKTLMSHMKELLSDSTEDKVRKSRILLEGRFFDYPLKVGNAVFNMPPLTTLRIMFDYVVIKLKNLFARAPDNNFENWVVNRFGWKLYDIYFRVYTEKTWGIPCTSLSADWAAQRITLLGLWDTLVKTLYKRGDAPRTYVSTFLYPSSGGIGRICEAYAKKVKDSGSDIRCGSKVEQVKVSDGKITEFNAGGANVPVTEEDIVFSTIPLTDFVRSITPSAPKDVLEACERLKFRSIVFVYLMLEKNSLSDDHWIYLPQQMFTSNRLSESRNFNASNAPAGKTVVGFEITCQMNDDVWNASKEDLTRWAVEDVVRSGLAKKEDVVGSAIHYMPHAYPIYDLGYRENLDKVLNYLKTLSNLRFFGRNGLFRYNNMDHSVGMGLFVADSITDKNINYMQVATENHWFG